MTTIPLWRPIEDAPRDGDDVFLLYKPDEPRSGESRFVGYWDDREGGWMPCYGTYVVQGVTHYMTVPGKPARVNLNH